MKKIIYILLFVSQVLNATTYYVAPSGGSDSNPGSIGSPWATWQYAFDQAGVGDTVYFRGGVWYPTEMVISGYGGHPAKVGTPGNLICFLNYPGETPILDCSNFTSTIANDYGLNMIGSIYIKLEGLTIRNCKQKVNDQYVVGVAISSAYGGPVWLTNITSHGHWGHGFQWAGYDTLYVTNCDSYNNADSISVEQGIGNRSDGFAGGSGGDEVDTFKVAYYEGCRAWHNSDDGFDLGTSKQFQVSNCWSFLNGYLPEGAGVAFKTGPSHIGISSKRRIYNTLAAFNNYPGYADQNMQDVYYGPVVEYINNTSYQNQMGFASDNGSFNCNTGRADVKYINNLVYDSELSYYDQAYLTLCHSAAPYYPNYTTTTTNTWIYDETAPYWLYNPNVTVTDDDFIETDYATAIAQLTAPRKADGSLPDIDFLKLSPASDLIDAGTSVGLDSYGIAPDIGAFEYSPGPQIIADHTVVDDYANIPQYYLDEVKKMWLSYAGESHSQAIRTGLLNLESDDAKYAVSVVEYADAPESYTTSNLRANRATWGDVDNSSGWRWSYGEEDWYTSSTAITRTKAGLDYYNNTGPEMAAFGFGWCWDPDEIGADITTYINTTKEYIEHCQTNDYLTKVFFTTGPVDDVNASGEIGYNKYLGHEAIRDSVVADTTRILFDYADILCYNTIDGTPTTTSWGEHTYPIITTVNLGDGSIGHISSEGALKLAKAMWWMLARIAGWDGNVSVYSEGEEPQIDSTLTDILTFTFPTETGSATINTTNHTVAIEVNHLATVTNLTPYISLSYGATISPASMTSRDFTNPQTYTVTALDGTTTQEWTVTVTQEEEPYVPPEVDTSRIIKFNGGHLRKFRP